MRRRRSPWPRAAEIVEMQRLARAVPIAPHITAYAVSVLAATHPDNRRAPALVRQYVRYGGSPRGAQALVTAGKILALMDGRFNVSVDDVRAAALPALRHRVILNFEGEAEGITSEAVVRVDPGRGGAALRGVGGDPRDHGPLPHPADRTGRRSRAPDAPPRRQRRPASPSASGVPAQRPRPHRLRRGLPAPARAAGRAHEAAGPGRAQGRAAERQARPVRGVRRLPRLHPGRRPAPAGLERLRPPREAVRQAVRRGGGRDDHVPPRRQPVDGLRAAAEAAVRQARRGRPRVHRPRRRGPRGDAPPCPGARPAGTAACAAPGAIFRLLGNLSGIQPAAGPTDLLLAARHAAAMLSGPRRRGPALGPARPVRGPRDPRAGRDRLRADRPPHALAGGAGPAARGRPEARGQRDRRGHRRHRRPGGARRLQGAPRSPGRTGLEDLARKRRASYVPISTDTPLADLVFAELRRRRVVG